MLWRFEAISTGNASVHTNGAAAVANIGRRESNGAIERGEVSAESAADARATLRSTGLRVLSVKPLQRSARRSGRGKVARQLYSAIAERFTSYQRGRRTQARADALDAIAMLLDSGVPLVGALDALASAENNGEVSSSIRRALLGVREDLRAGTSFPEALRSQPGWFDPVEIALISAAESGAGGLACTLRELSDRHSMSAKLSQKLVGALTYPAIVASIGAAVALFLALRTLPQLSAVLTSAKLEVPALTQAVMSIGTFLVGWGWSVFFVVGALAIFLALARHFRLAEFLPLGVRRLLIFRSAPRVMRRIALARVSILLADLLRAKIPLDAALRLAAPTCRGFAGGLGRALIAAADRIEHGESVVEALSPKRVDEGARIPGEGRDQAAFAGWFDREFLQLVSVGDSSGELAKVLDRVGRRYERQSTRQIDRLASVLEPATIVLLAVFVGTVVMAAVLPLVKLQEVLR